MLVTLFLSAFLAATLLPAQSEVVLVVLDQQGAHSAAILALVATAGNVLGACVNYVLGRALMRFKDAQWFPVSAKNIARAQTQYQRFGVWSLLFSWLPIIGDPLTLVAGIFGTRWWLFLGLVTLGKGTRYVVLLWASSMF